MATGIKVLCISSAQGRFEDCRFWFLFFYTCQIRSFGFVTNLIPPSHTLIL